MVPFITNYPAVSPPFQDGTRIQTTVPSIITYLPTILSFGDRTPPISTHRQIMVVNSTFTNVMFPLFRGGMLKKTMEQNIITIPRLTV